jgi:hypothetical protein
MQFYYVVLLVVSVGFQCMARVHCDFCLTRHPSPAGRNCLFRYWPLDCEWAALMSGTEEIVTSVGGDNIMPDPPVVSSVGDINVAPLPPSSSSVAVSQSELPDLAGEIARSEVLNSTTQSERSDRSRGSNRSRASITDDTVYVSRNA